MSYGRLLFLSLSPVYQCLWGKSLCRELHRPYLITQKQTTKKGKFSDKKKSDIFHISAQNIDCLYSLEPPRRGGSNEYPQSIFLEK